VARSKPNSPRSAIPLDNLLGEANELDWLAYERHLRALNRSRGTIVSYRQALADLANAHPGQSISELTKPELEEHLAELQERLGSATVAIRYRNLRAWYSWCVQEEIIPEHPMRRMREPKVTDELPMVLELEQLQALLRACVGVDFAARRDSAIIRLFCEPGSPRCAEMAGLTMDDVDWRGSSIRVRGKGDKVRTIPFGARTGQAMDRYRRVRARQDSAHLPNLWLSSKRKLVGLTDSGIRAMLERRSTQAGIPPVHPHMLRHTAMHRWDLAGGSEADAMQLFGWSSAEMPRRYGRSAGNARAQHAARRHSLGDQI
jgi:site-specific recombinase XerD